MLGACAFAQTTGAPAAGSPGAATVAARSDSTDLDDIAKRADAAYARKDYGTAASLYQQLAESGRADAMTRLGGMYENAQGLTQDFATALAWYRKSAERGDPAGMFHVGVMYATGRGVVKDIVQAAVWYRKAAELGDPSGMNVIGRLYRTGRGGLPQDDAEAAVWFRKSAEKGDPFGMFTFGLIYEEGRGVAQDDAEAATWFRRSAEKGNEAGMYRLGMMYEAGRGVPQDNTQAIAWYRKGAELGFTPARANLIRLAKDLGVDPGVTEATNAVAPTPTAPGVFRIGRGVSPPVAVYKVEPEYSKQARKAKFQGTVVLSIVIDETGQPTNIKIVRPLGLGLDEKAIEAVKQWRFTPGMKDGKAVAVLATVEVNFKLRKDR